MAYNWIFLVYAKYSSKCLSCHILIKEGESAWWLKNMGLMHKHCGLGSKSKLLPSIYVEEPDYDKNMYDNYHKHNPEFYAAKKLRESFDN